MTLTSHHSASIPAGDAQPDADATRTTTRRLRADVEPARNGDSRPSFVRTGMPRLQLPPQPFGRASVPPVAGADTPSAPPGEYRAIESLTQFALTHSTAPAAAPQTAPLRRPFGDSASTGAQVAPDRRSHARGGSDRRSVPRTFESPWMAPPHGVLDPRPTAQPPTAEPQVIAPVGQVMPELPDVSDLRVAAAPVPASGEAHTHATAPAHPSAASQVSAPSAVAPVAAAQFAHVPADAPQRAAVADPLGGIFGAPTGVVATAIDPRAWFPGAANAVRHAAPSQPVQVTPIASAPQDPSVPPPPGAPALPPPAAPLEALPAPAPAGATPNAFLGLEPSRATAAVAPFAAAVGDPHVSFSTTLALTPLPAPADLADAIGDSIALRPVAARATGSAHHAQSGSTLLRWGFLVSLPALTGVGIGYLLSLLLFG